MISRTRRNCALFALLLALCMSSLAFTCKWEQTTYQTLSTAKTLIDGAATDYNAGNLPQTTKVHDTIEEARLAQTAAVNAFEAYVVSKSINDPDATLETKRQALVTAMTSVATAVTAIQTLYTEVKQ